MKRKILAYLLTLTMVLSLIPAFTLTASAKDPIVVTTTADDADVPVAGSLREAIASATADGDEITFSIPNADPGYNSDDGTWTISLKSEIAINVAIAIEGEGKIIIDGGGKCRVFSYNDSAYEDYAASKKLELKGLTIANGKHESETYGLGNGGGIYVNEGNLHLTECVFVGNTAGSGNLAVGYSGYGGGVYVETGLVTLVRCAFEGNTSNMGGGLLVSSGDVMATGCTFKDNTGFSGGGGIWASNGDVIAEDCDFIENTAGDVENIGDGGGVYARLGANLIRCTFENNTANMGGGVCVSSGNATVEKCEFTGNTVFYSGGGVYAGGEVVVTNTNFKGNESHGSGGGVYAGKSVIGIECVFTGNKAGSGGGISADDNVVAENCIFTDNKAETGGGIYNAYEDEDETDVTVLTNCVLTGNETVADHSGTIHSKQAYLYHTTMADNKGKGVYIYVGDDVEEGSIPVPAALYVYNSVIVGNGDETVRYGTPYLCYPYSDADIIGDSLIEGVGNATHVSVFGANTTDEDGILKPLGDGLADGTATALTADDIEVPEDADESDILDVLLNDIVRMPRAIDGAVSYGAVETAEDSIVSVAYYEDSLAKKPNSYKSGDALKLDGGALTATYNSGKTAAVSFSDPNVTRSEFLPNQLGDQGVTFTYFEKTATVTFTVSKKETSGSSSSSSSVPKDSVISSETVTAQRDEDGKNEDITITLTGNGNTLSDVTNNGEKLERGKDYTVDGDKVTIKGEYLDGLAAGEYTFTFDMNRGTDPTLIVTIEEIEIPLAEWVNPFIDVTKDDWFYDDVKYTHQNGLFKGTTATTFSPQMPITRGMVVTVLGRLAGIDIADYSGASFDDVDPGMYYAPYIKWAAELGIVKGIGDNKFAPDASVSRQDLATILNNYAEKMGIVMAQTMQIVVFVDSADIADYAVDAVGNMVRANIINGKPGNIFDPLADATRAEVAAMLHRFADAAK